MAWGSANSNSASGKIGRQKIGRQRRFIPLQDSLMTGRPPQKNAFPGAKVSLHPVNASRSQVDRKRVSELDIPSQFDYTCPVEGAGVDPKSRALNGIKAVIRTSIGRRCPEGRVIKGIQHLSLQAETKPLSDREVLSDGDVIVSVMGPVKPYSLAEGTRCDIGIDVRRVRATR